MAHILDDTADWITGEVTAMSLHTADPGDAGADEVSGGGYARLVPTWTAASGGTATLSATLEFSGPAGTQVTHLGLHNASGFWEGVALDSPITFNLDGRVDISAGTVSVADAA